MIGPTRISVIVAAYNAGDYIDATLRSALAQTHEDLEVVVVDDGSTDDTADRVERVAAQDSRVRLLRQSNQGVAAARNAAIAVAGGAYIAPLDADDLWDPEKLARQLEALQRGGPEAVLAYCWWAWIDLRCRVMDRSPRWRVEGRALERLIQVNFTGGASVPLIRRAALEAIGGYDPSLRDRGCQGCEDWDVVLRLAAIGSIVAVPATLVAYRRRSDSMSSACDTMWRSRSAVMDALVRRTPAVDRALVRSSRGQFALYLAGVAYWSGDMRAAVQWTLRAGPLRLLTAVAPYVLRLLARPARDRVAHNPTVPANGRLSDLDLPEPLIPYDRIYDRQWDGRAAR